ncbi:MAG: SUMF1/EgtB/PvdO family nonheme iron enzyme, partial [Verrucomicrobia bacterium]|nr:SUMF1/EgtB/PvdO family nonheme iron enzyme [Verrucomicrobiota bacterium]
MSSLAGQTFAGYEIIAKLGQGGMGAVYKARQPNLDRLAALKVMASELAADPDFVARFKREATAAANLSHPNIVQVYSAGESEGTHYIAMEFVDGVTLKQHIERQGRLDPREAIAITVLVAEALQYGWNKARLIHRDIKPDNIFLSQTGEVKVGDLGLAKTVGGGTTSLTQTGMMMGSPHYISPEQARGLSDVDFKTDIYSLGCTLYHMLTGRPPYEGSDALAVIGKHVHEPPPAIFKVWPTCPIPVALVVGKMLAKQRHERPASYEDLIEQLREVHGKLKPVTAVAPVSASEPTQMLPSPAPAPPTPKPAVAKTPKTPKPRVESRESRAGSRGPKVVIGVGALAVMALIAGAVWWFAGGGGEPKVLDLGGGVKMELVAIPPGEFMMGSTGVEKAWTAAQAYCGLPKNEGEAPRKATIKQGFWMGRTEVTMGQWKQFVNATGYKSEVERMSLTVWTYDPTQKKWEGRKGVTWRDPGFGFSMQDNHPVCCVTWNDAVAFCEWLAQREQEAGCLPAGYKIRLPTEAEWEYGCRAGTQTKFWWGDSVEDAQGRVNWAGEEDGFECVHPADHYGARGRNGFGLADMIGNVPESCLDGYDPKGAHEEFYPGSPDARAMRGAAFWHLPGQSRCACRCMVPTSGAWSGYGFRVCLGPDVLGSASAAPVSTPEPQAAPPAADASGYKPLFNGKDLTGWKVRENANNNWSAEGGVLVNSRSGADLITEETFTDFELHLEFKLPPQGNSGVYLRGRQELQLADDCGQPAGLDTTGGIWGRIAPSENASKPVNEWQTLDVTLIGKEATVTINGRKVINAARISGVSTWAGLDNNVDQPGPIMLQGRLSAVSFRNIRIKPLPAAAAKADETKLLDLGGGVKMELVAIPPGEFLMGSTPEEQAWAVKNRLKEGDVKCEGEMPRKTTIKDGFWLGRTEVTVGQWKEFVTATGYKTDAEKKGYVDAAPRKGKAWGRADGLSWRDPGFGAAPQDNDPVCCVSWNDAMAFCEWATERERKAGRLAANQVARLPAEAEWEYACRAGTQTKFWWGEAKEDGKDRLNWSGKDDGYDFVSPVDTFGKRGRNGFGLADMLGNVLEWCLDEYDAKQAHEECYKGNPGARVLRGGSFFFVPAICRCASRSSGDPAILLAMFGFRVAVGVDVLGSATSAAPAIPADAAAWQNAINLLPLVDIEKDKVSGTWTAANGELTATDVKAASQ